MAWLFSFDVSPTMPRKSIHRFDAVDARGKAYRIFEWITDAAASNGKHPASVPPPPVLFTSDGEDVVWLSKGQYRIEKTGAMLTSDDPRAY